MLAFTSANEISFVSCMHIIFSINFFENISLKKIRIARLCMHLILNDLKISVSDLLKRLWWTDFESVLPMNSPACNMMQCFVTQTLRVTIIKRTVCHHCFVFNTIAKIFFLWVFLWNRHATIQCDHYLSGKR